MSENESMETTETVVGSGGEATVEDLAREAASWFERRSRADGETFVTLKDGRPAWVQEMVYAAHGDFGPDDWRYDCIAAALDQIEETGDEDSGEFADSQVDVYTGRRLQWLASSLNRVGYCDEAASEFGPPRDGLGKYDIAESIGLGQFAEASEVFGSVAQSLADRLDEVTE